MSRCKVVTGLGILGVLGTVWIGQALSQEGGGAGARRQRFDPAQMRQRSLDRIKEFMGATDQEWLVLGPRIEKVQTLSRQTRGMGGMRVRRQPRGAEGVAPAPATPAAQLSPVAKATQDLRTVLEDKDAKPAAIKAKLTALREAREKAKQELAKAQKALLEVVTQRQEAQLVLSGLVD